MAIMDRVRRGEFDLGGVPTSLLPLIRRCLDPEPTRRPTLPMILAELGGTVPVAPAEQPRFEYEPTRMLTASIPALVPASPLVQQFGEVPPASRFRQRAGLFGVGLAGAGLVAAAPYVGAVALGIAVALLRFVSVTSQRHRWRSERRGERRWYDSTASTLASPSYLIASLGGTLALLGLAVFLTGLVVFLVAASHTSTDNGLLAIGVIVVASLWWGPGSLRVRRVARSWTSAWAGSDHTWLVVLAGGLAVFAGALLMLGFHGPWWYPQSLAPWDSGWLADLAARMRG